ncbi:MAG: translational GTPase TypA [Cyanobacteria bacterium]|nr:translational GTPase TypA [Cyanobacteriota bacterium]MDA1021453.1 translational GTPase TypA [Cyanobacteriota bacterium]
MTYNYFALSQSTISHIRNLAIIAHVDHGKTTLLDAILSHTGSLDNHKEYDSCIMDSNPLERERGITISSKNTTVKYADHIINIIDTPGHSDFGGEVERVLGMVQGCLLLVDAFEGPMPQTRFVLKKAFEQGLKPIVVINKIDKPNTTIDRVIDNVLELFIDLGATDEQIDFPIIYASGIKGITSLDLEAALASTENDIKPLMDVILKTVPPAPGNVDAPFLFQAVSLDANDYMGRMQIGRILNGTVKVNDQVNWIDAVDKAVVKKKIARIYGFNGLAKVEIPEASAGMIIMIAGIEGANIGDTICDLSLTEALPSILIDEPTLEMVFSVNDSPFAGLEGKFVTSRQIKDRLEKELAVNVALRVQDTDRTDSFAVAGRGELHLGILIETMRREGYELQVSKPHIVKKIVDGAVHEPFEELVIDVPEENAGACIEALGKRKMEMIAMNTIQGRSVVTFHIPTRGLIGFNNDFVKITKGEGIMNHSFLDYRPSVGEMNRVRSGVLINLETGRVTPYALQQFADRGIFFIEPGIEVYKGMVVGEANRPQDITINLTKEKQLTNMRTSGSDTLVHLKTPKKMLLEEALVYINDDELVEVTPLNIRLRKTVLDKKEARATKPKGQP